MMLAVISADASAAVVSPDPLSISQIAGYVAAVLVGGGAAWKVGLVLLARLSVALAGARSEKDAIARLEAQLEAALKNEADARRAANDAYRERNEILRELGNVKAELAGLTERAKLQAETIERQSQQISDLTGQVSKLREVINGKANF
ncbi:hypothetical protein [Achromobacter aloeverae]